MSSIGMRGAAAGPIIDARARWGLLARSPESDAVGCGSRRQRRTAGCCARGSRKSTTRCGKVSASASTSNSAPRLADILVQLQGNFTDVLSGDANAYSIDEGGQ
jgi:hypothetical protein